MLYCLVMTTALRDNLRYFLVTMIVVSWAGCLIVSVDDLLRHRNLLQILMGLPLIAVTNGLCSIYLYKKAQSKKVEWGLFGFLLNVFAVFVYWLALDVKSKWDKGERYFG